MELEWDIENVLKNMYGKIAEVNFNKNASNIDIYLKNLLKPLKDYFYRFFEILDTKELLPRNYQHFTQFTQLVSDIFVAIEAYLSGVLDRTKLLNLLKNKEEFLLSTDVSSLFRIRSLSS